MQVVEKKIFIGFTTEGSACSLHLVTEELHQTKHYSDLIGHLIYHYHEDRAILCDLITFEMPMDCRSEDNSLTLCSFSEVLADIFMFLLKDALKRQVTNHAQLPAMEEDSFFDNSSLEVAVAA